MATDRELLILVAERAIEANAAWKARNAARAALRKFYREYRDQTGEFYDRQDSIDNDDLAEAEKFDALMAEHKATRRALASKRGALRTAIAKATKQGIPA